MPVASGFVRRLPPLRFAQSEEKFRKEVLEELSRSSSAVPRGAALRKALAHLVLVLGAYGLQLWGGLSGVALLAIVAFSQPLYLLAATGIAHDASHHALSRRPFWNRLGVFVFDILGVNGYIWHFDHVTAHHSAPNVTRYDANLTGWGPLRLDPHVSLEPRHRYQHLFAPLLYSVASLFKIYLADFVAFTRTRCEAYLPQRHAKKEVARLIGFKLWAICTLLIVPYWCNAWATEVLIGYVVGHFATGLLMGAIFQPTHTNLLVAWPQADEDGRVPGSFESHVFETTADFAIESRLVTWISGGLNIHAIHHLFPLLSQVQLMEAARIVRRIAPRYGLEYQVLGSWSQALKSHFRALYRLGRAAGGA